MTNQVIDYSAEPNFFKLQAVRIPKPVGYWRLCKGAIATKLPIYEKPTPEQIKNTEETFGWVFEDA